MAGNIVTGNGDQGEHRRFTYTPLEGPDGQERLTNTEAERLVSEIRDWAGQFQHESPDAFALCDAMGDLQRLFVRASTEIDEALLRLKLMTLQPRQADEHLGIARKYLNRWQDRGGRCGNANLHHDARRAHRGQRDA